MVRVFYFTANGEDVARAAEVLTAPEFSVTSPPTLEQLLLDLTDASAEQTQRMVLCAIEHPCMPSVRLIDTLRSCFPDVPVIVALKAGHAPALAEALQQGASGFALVGEQYWTKLPDMIREVLGKVSRRCTRPDIRGPAQPNGGITGEFHAPPAGSNALSKQLVRLREEESARIARELHDELGQALTGLKLDVAWLQRRLDKLPQAPVVSEMRARLELMLKCIDGTVAITRRICTELRPAILDDLGLLAAINWQADEFKKRTNVPVELSLPAAEPALDPTCTTAVFRIFQEIMTNIARHANASHVRVTLAESDKHLQLEVRDNGRGFDQTALAGREALGILGMRERARACEGVLTIQTAPGQGTMVQLRIPLAHRPHS
jgi:signal transduction histidine kinase